MREFSSHNIIDSPGKDKIWGQMHFPKPRRRHFPIMVQNWPGMSGLALVLPSALRVRHCFGDLFVAVQITLDIGCLDNIMWSSPTVLTKTSKVIFVLNPSCRCGPGDIWFWKHLKNWLSWMLRIVLSHVAAGNSAEILHLTSLIAHCMHSDLWKKWPKGKS